MNTRLWAQLASDGSYYSLDENGYVILYKSQAHAEEDQITMGVPVEELRRVREVNVTIIPVEAHD